jgi:hypothetical protein
MTAILSYAPIQTSYSSEGIDATIVIPVEGGPARKKQDLFLPGHIVNCQWLLTSHADYTRFMGFFISTIRYGLDDFLCDVITDIGVPTTHLCRTLGGIPKLVQQKNEAYWVSCTLQCTKNPTFTDTITYSIGEGSDWTFDGVDDEIDLGDVLDFARTDPFSMFFWYATTSTDRCAIGKQSAGNQQGFRFVVKSSTGSGSNQDFIFAGPSATQQIQVGCTPRPPMDGDLHHFGLTYDGSSVGAGFTFYLDGVAITTNVGTDNLTSASTVNSENLKIGKRGSTLPFDGTLKHVSIWDKELSPSEVDETYNVPTFPNLTSTSMAANLVLWLKIDGTDTTGAGGVTDYSSSNFDGTAQNGLGVGAPGQGAITYNNISRHFKAGDQVRILNSVGVHPDGDIPLNLDGVYDVSAQAGNNTILLDAPASVNEDWQTLFDISPTAEYGGGELTGIVLSTVTKVPS